METCPLESSSVCCTPLQDIASRLPAADADLHIHWVRTSPCSALQCAVEVQPLQLADFAPFLFFQLSGFSAPCMVAQRAWAVERVLPGIAVNALHTLPLIS